MSTEYTKDQCGSRGNHTGKCNQLLRHLSAARASVRVSQCSLSTVISMPHSIKDPYD